MKGEKTMFINGIWKVGVVALALAFMSGKAWAADGGGPEFGPYQLEVGLEYESLDADSADETLILVSGTWHFKEVAETMLSRLS